MTLRKLLAAGLLSTLTATASAAVLTFEGSTTTGASRQLDAATENAHGPSLIDYAGYDWLGMMVSRPLVSVNRPQRITGFEQDPEDGPVAITAPVETGFHRAAVSGDTVAYTLATGGSSLFASIKARPGDDNFSFLGGWLTSAYRADLDVLVTGLRDGAVVYERRLVVSDAGPTEYLFDFLDIDELRFLSSGGSFLYPNGNGIGDYRNPSNAFSAPVLAFDDLSLERYVATVPLPATGALLGLGLAGVGLAGRRRRG